MADTQLILDDFSTKLKHDPGRCSIVAPVPLMDSKSAQENEQNA